jgi:hypothetical protein
MLQVSMNICSGQGPINWSPMMWKFESSKEFTNFIRQEILNILNWAVENHFPKSQLTLCVVIHEDVIGEDTQQWVWDFIIPVKNIREAKPYLKLGIEEFETELRNRKIEDLI